MTEERQEPTSGEPREVKPKDTLEVTRREFLRRAGMVTGLAGFALLGADVLLDTILERMESVRGTHRLAAGLAREASELGIVSRAAADDAGAEGTTNCGGYSLYCSDNGVGVHVCSPDGDNGYTCNSFRCEDVNPLPLSDQGFSIPGCDGYSTPYDCGGQDEFHCMTKFSCNGPFSCCGGNPDADFVCNPPANPGPGQTFSCTTSFHCEGDFWCLPNSNNGCNDSKFHCISGAFTPPDDCPSYNCPTPNQYDGIPGCG